VKTQNPLKIFLYCDGAEFDGSTLEKKSCGGSETAGIQAAKALGDLGNEVTVFSECDGPNTSPGIYDGVRYISHKQFVHMATKVPHDINIISRRHSLLNNQFNSKINILWQEELAFINQKKEFDDSIWNTDCVFALTEFHKYQQSKVFNIPEDRMWIAGNGIDLELIGEDNLKRDPNKLIYASRPERGLDVLLTRIFPELLKHISTLKLYITTYDFFPPQIAHLINQLKEFSKQFGDSVVWLPPLNKKELYNHLKTSSLYIYPTDHEETYMILAAEAQACGLPIVTRGVGAIPDVMNPEAGYMINGYDTIYNPGFQVEFINRSLELLKDKDKWNKASEIGKNHVKQFDWKENIKRWDSKFRELLNKHNFGNKQPQRDSLSVIITTKDDEDTIEGCLDSVKDIANEIIVADLGSKDSTLSILEKYNCKILDNCFDIDLLGYEHPRNKCLKNVNGNWVLWLYPEERLENPENIEKYLRNNYWEGYSIRESLDYIFPSTDLFIDSPARLFRNNKDINFKGMVFERPEKKLNQGTGKTIEIKDVSIINTRLKENENYFKCIFSLLERDRLKYPDRYIGISYFISILINLIDRITKTGAMTQEAISGCEKIINLYEKYFIDKTNCFSRFNIHHYSKANKYLNKGIDVSWNIGIDKIDSKLNGGHNKIRFSDINKAKDYINLWMDKNNEKFDSKYYLSQGL